jgi:hypothetical protein
MLNNNLLLCFCSFALIASQAMGAIHICVLVKCNIAKFISNITMAFVPCGVGNVLQNKVLVK